MSAEKELRIGNGLGSEDYFSFIDGSPMDPDADRKMDWRRTLAFFDEHVRA